MSPRSPRQSCSLVPYLGAALLLCGLLSLLPAGAQEAPGLEVVVEGVEGELRDNVRAFLGLVPLTEEDTELPGEPRLRWLHRRAPDDVREALRPFGYYRPELESTLERTETGWRATYRIDPGPALPLAALDLQLRGPGQDDPVLRQLIEKSELKTGEALDQRRYEKLKTRLQAVATERGYFDARFERSRIAVDLQAYEARVSLIYATGERYRLGEVKFENSALGEKLLNRYVRIKPGQPYSSSALLQLQSDLINSNYFEQALIDASPENAVDRVIPVTVQLSMRKRSE
ncbi:MAG: POTRA domain-containing protein, partial [Candidatus Competibacterales bacterium]|nr:POTRA domain-containing protein [Candidatus Competibacterales bacterium]